MPFGKIQIDYSDPNQTPTTFKKYYDTVGDAGNFLASGGSDITLTGVTPGTGCSNAGLLIRAFLKALEIIAPTGTIIRSITADWRNTGGPATVDASTFYTASDFTPAGGTAGFGPKNKGFVAFAGLVPATHKTGWLRMYSSGSDLWAAPTQGDTTLIDSTFKAFLEDFITVGGNLIGPAVWTGKLTVGGSWTGQQPFQVGHYHLGDRNG
jgi:hypothetical protein